MRYLKFILLTLLSIYFGPFFHTIVLNTLDYFYPVNLNDDGYLTTMELCQKYNYHCEEHFVTTSDGYILAIHRIIGRTNGTTISKKAPTVLILHGIFSASTPFILDAEKSPGGILSDNGLDVWIGNSRGNRYSRNHTKLNPEDSKFWDFSSFDMATKDLPSMIDYILNKVNKKSLHFVGYSMGGYLINGILVYKPEFNEKIKSLTYLASSSMFTKFDSIILRTILSLVRPISYVYKPFEIGPYTKSNVRTNYRYFNPNSIFFKFMMIFLEDLLGADNGNCNKDRFPYYMAHFSNGASFNQILHLYQTSCMGKVGFYDHGPKKNMEIYGQKTPFYDFTAIRPPKILFYGTHDKIINKDSVLAGVASMKNVKKVVKVEGYNHFHFIFARNLKQNVYDIVTKFIETCD